MDLDLDNGLSAVAEEIEIFTSDSGASCRETCENEGMSCSAEHFPTINNCNQLRIHFMCEAGCGPSTEDSTEFPGYVVAAAPKPKWPAFCYYLEQVPAETEADSSLDLPEERTEDVDQLFAARRHGNLTKASDWGTDGAVQPFSCDAQGGHVKRLCPCKSKLVLKDGPHSAAVKYEG